MNFRHTIVIGVSLLPALLAGCVAPDEPTVDPFLPELTVTLPANSVSTSAPNAAPAPTPTSGLVMTTAYPPVDYAPLIDQIKAYVKEAGLGAKFDMAVGFVDVQTGQTASFDGDSKHLSLSTFKGPLGAYYLWLVERGTVKPQASDDALLVAMMNESDNGATSCVFKHVGGLAGFNDWLAAQGMTRENNFIARWQNWGCAENGKTTLLPPDPRYEGKGDPALNLPGNYAVQTCAPKRQRCTEAFAPLELAKLYARIYAGAVLTADDTTRWLNWMEKKRENIAFDKLLPAFAPVRAYVKNGFDAQDAVDPLNYYHEAGIVETPYGVYTLAVFTQGDPDWPATGPVAVVGKLVYDYFADAHRGR